MTKHRQVLHHLPPPIVPHGSSQVRISHLTTAQIKEGYSVADFTETKVPVTGERKTTPTLCAAYNSPKKKHEENCLSYTH